MSFLFLKTCWTLIQFDLRLMRGNFADLHDRVNRQRTAPAGKRRYSIDEICRAVDIICIWYWKRVLCLQRSAATACLLKQEGFDAKMVIGVQLLPYRAHAWVQVNGRVVNDRADLLETYAILDEC